MSARKAARSRAVLRGESDWIRHVIAGIPGGSGVVLGPGDDAALLQPSAGLELVATTDAFIEGVHWRASLLDHEGVGRRLAAANLSDVAAMAAAPRWALLSAGVPTRWNADAMAAVERGLAAALAAQGAAIVGGNLTRTGGPAWFSLALLGEVASGCAWTRVGARPGDRLVVTGSPGRAGAAVRVGDAAHRVRFTAPACEPLLRGFQSPPSRVAFARAAAASGAVTAAIDLSDGFRGDLERLCEASGVGAEITATAWRRDDALSEAARLLAFQRVAGARWARSSHRWMRYHAPPRTHARLLESLRFGPSDDYELLMAVDPAKERALVEAAQATAAPLLWLGQFTDAPGRLLVRDPDGALRTMPGRGFDHFA